MPKKNKQQRKKQVKQLAHDIQVLANTQNRPKGARKKKREQVQALQLGKCSLKLLKLIKDPFSARDICMAASQSPPSFKVRCYHTVNLSVNANGYQYLYMSPTTANDAPCIFYLQNAANGDAYDGGVPSFSQDADANTAQNVTSDGTIPNIPYPVSAFDVSSTRESALIGRVVALSIRIRYTGTELNKSGKILAYASPNNNRIDRFNLDTIQGLQGCIKTPTTREWVQVTEIASQSNTMRYPGYDDSIQSGGGGATPYGTKNGYIYPWADSSNTMKYIGGAGGENDYGAPTIMVAVVGAVEGESFEVQVCQHIEYIGATVGALVTHSDTDERGRDTVVTALTDMYASLTGNKFTVKDMAHRLKPSLIRVAQAAAPVSTAAIMAIVNA